MKTLLAFLLLCSTCLAQVTAVIEGPDEVEAGDTFRLDAGESVCETRTWMLAASSKQLMTFESDRYCVFGTGRPGDYEFILFTAGKDADGKVVSAAVKHIVKVTGGGLPPIPSPVPPPNPAPIPPPTPVPPSPLTGLQLRAFTAVKSIVTKPGEVAHYAASLRAGAAVSGTVEQMRDEYRLKILSGSFTSPEVQQRWNPMQQLLLAEMNETRDSTVARQVFADVATGLERSLTTSVGTAARESLMQRKSAVEGAVESLEAEIGIR